MRRKGFTLIELLITVAIMATLMTIMFKLGASSSDETARLNTVSRMQKLENCLSGYYAAFGCYPPVALHGSRDIYAKVENGVQDSSERESTPTWETIEAACKSQPMEACFPFSSDMENEIREYSNYYKQNAADYRNSKYATELSTGFGVPSPGEFTQYWDYKGWEQVQLFKFGVMSFIIPRYLLMMKGDAQFYGAGVGGDACEQWNANNEKCISAITGEEMSWKDVRESVERSETDYNGNGGINDINKYVAVANIASQSACARWLANLEGICATASSKSETKIYGITLKDENVSLFNFESTGGDDSDGSNSIEIYSPGAEGGSYYVLDMITVLDGWKNCFYYYSPSGYQSYVLWSAGANRRTFPPWIDKSKFLDDTPADPKNSGNLMTVAEWVSDDIMGMKH